MGAFLSNILALYVLLKSYFKDFGVQLFYTASVAVIMLAPLLFASISALFSALETCHEKSSTMDKYVASAVEFFLFFVNLLKMVERWHRDLQCMEEWYMHEPIMINVVLMLLWLAILCISGMVRTYAGVSVMEGLFTMRSPWMNEIYFSNVLRRDNCVEMTSDSAH